MFLIKQEFYFTENTKRVTLSPQPKKKLKSALLNAIHMSQKNRIVIKIQPGRKIVIPKCMHKYTRD